MVLDARLQAVASFVEPDSRVADIGTDHAYLAVELIRSGKAASVIASDKNIGPCAMAERMILSADFADRIEVRQGDGLKTIFPGEVSTICLAGMGGVLISQILQAAPQVLRQAVRLVLQPMNGAFELRSWLYGNGWQLVDEALAEAEGHIYVIMAAEPGLTDIPSRGELLAGPVLCRKKPVLLKKYIGQMLTKKKKEAAGLSLGHEKRARERLLLIRQEIAELEAIESC